MTNPKNPKHPKHPEPNPIEEAIGDRANPPAKLTIEELQKVAEDVKKAAIQKGTILVPMNPSKIPDEPSPSEMLTLEELNRRTEKRLQDEPEKETAGIIIPENTNPRDKSTSTMTVGAKIPVSKQDPPPQEKEIYFQESPPQNDDDLKAALGAINKAAKTLPAEDIELTALRKYILEDGFNVSAVAFHIVTLCSHPLVTTSTTTWDYKDRANVPDMVLALLNQPGYLEGIWPSLKIVMGSNIGNSAWAAGISTTIAFFDTVRVLPALKDLQNEEKP